jgi:hypothetical protein
MTIANARVWEKSKKPAEVTRMGKRACLLAGGKRTPIIFAAKAEFQIGKDPHMRMKFGKFLLVAGVLIASLTLKAPTAKADSYTYTFTGSGSFLGDDFTYTSTSGFLAPSNLIVVPDSASGGVSGMVFPSSDALLLRFAIGQFEDVAGIPYSLTMLGDQILDGGDLSISRAAIAAAEPGTLGLMITGLGFLGFLRRRSPSGILFNSVWHFSLRRPAQGHKTPYIV